MTDLVVEALEVRYGAVPAVRGVSFEVKPGEIVGLIGPNGAGKSSTLHAIMGAAPITRGDVRLGGTSLVRRSSEDIARLGRRARARGAADLRRALPSRRISGSAWPARRSRSDPAAALGRAYELFPIVQEFRRRHAGRPLRRPAAAARDRAGARLGAGRAACSTSRRSGSRRASWTSSSTRWPRFATSGLAVLLVEQRAQRTVALADRSHVLANGELRLTLGREDAADTDKLVAAYFA